MLAILFKQKSKKLKKFCQCNKCASLNLIKFHAWKKTNNKLCSISFAQKLHFYVYRNYSECN